MLVFPTCDPPFLFAGALIFDRTGAARIGPFTIERQPFFGIGVAIRQKLPCRADIKIIVGDIAKISFDKPVERSRAGFSDHCNIQQQNVIDDEENDG
jgi:hypothetical protein